MASCQSYIIALLCLISTSLVSSYNQGSCNQILKTYPNAPSGIYHVQAGTYNIIEVYCEMGLNGGGFTFLSPRSLAEITDEDLQSLITDRKSVLMRIRRCDGTQTYTVLEQLSRYSHIPIKYSLSNYTGYQGPLNAPILGNPYIFVGFLPRNVAAARTTQGVKANGNDRSFNNGDANGNSYMALFPNFKEKTPTTYLLGVEWPLCNLIFNGAVQNPSGRIMPPEYFLFSEFHFGGGGCYSQSDSRLKSKCILGFHIGFR